MSINSQELIFPSLYTVTKQRGEQYGLGYRHTECNKLY